MKANWAQKIPNSWWLFSIAVIAVTLSLIEISDLFQFPFESAVGNSSITAIFTGFVDIMYTAGYAGLFLCMFLENMSLPIPSEVFLPLAGYFVFEGRMTFPLALTVSTVAGLLGSLAIYFLALVLGRPPIYRLVKRFGVSNDSLAKSEAWLSGPGGSVLILIARFVPGIRSSISIPAGVLKMNPVHFTVMTLIGTLGWSAILIFLGYFIGPTWATAGTQITNILIQVTIYAAAALSIFYIAYFIYRRFSVSSTVSPDHH